MALATKTLLGITPVSWRLRAARPAPSNWTAHELYTERYNISSYACFLKSANYRNCKIVNKHVNILPESAVTPARLGECRLPQSSPSSQEKLLRNIAIEMVWAWLKSSSETARLQLALKSIIKQDFETNSITIACHVYASHVIYNVM